MSALERAINWWSHQHPLVKATLRPVFKPFVWYRIRTIGRSLVRERRWRGPIVWQKLKRDGSNVSLGPVTGRGTYTEGMHLPVLLVGRYKDHTVRLVYNVPAEYHAVGTTF